ncbi:Med21 domain-containing protein [Rhizoctonia solani AG-1 IA]|uniref:Mediator of RNA polymerase II transcription subunit 21 n=1 Tax=Thanatephorus cucumeris (strain AG1-IA) TaxID=983506 RepID=L8X407_THACA|nr:Med21 domain-containing protein [Rhizoctonia solani AG-1 IA]
MGPRHCTSVILELACSDNLVEAAFLVCGTSGVPAATPQSKIEFERTAARGKCPSCTRSSPRTWTNLPSYMTRSNQYALLVIMSNSVVYLVTRNSFRQVNPDIPITKTRPPDKEDSPDVFEANKRELVNDLITKAKQIEYLIKSLPPPEPESEQACTSAAGCGCKVGLTRSGDETSKRGVSAGAGSCATIAYSGWGGVGTYAQ